MREGNHYRETTPQRTDTPPVVVDTPAAFEAMLADVQHASILAVDTEANGLYAYRERIALIQISTEAQDYIIDPLADIPLQALGPILADPAVEKVFHAAEYDLMGLRRDFGFEVRGLFDTMHAARLLGKPEVGLAALVRAYFGVRLNKRYQRANWAQRPLPPEMLAYARLDTHYLIPLRHALAAELRRRGLWDLAQEDFERLSQVRLPDRSFDPDGFWRLPGALDLPPAGRAVLQALYLWREEEAQRRDVPPFKVLTNEDLVLLARHRPTSLKALRRVRRHLAEQPVGHTLVRLVREARTRTPPEPPAQRNGHARAYRERVQRLRAWRRRLAEQLGVPSDIVLPRTAMEAIAQANPRTLSDLERLGVLGPVRLKRFGASLLEALHAPPG